MSIGQFGRFTVALIRRWPVALALAVASPAIVATIFWHRGGEAPRPALLSSSLVRPSAPADAPLPPSAESDAQVRAALHGASAKASFRSWMQQSDLVRRAVIALDNIAGDEVPRQPLAFLAPARRFHAHGMTGHLHIAESTYRRFDPVAEGIASIDAGVVASAYRTLHPLLSAAYHALGYPGRSVDEVARQALQRLTDAPVYQGEVAVNRVDHVYLFADPTLEALGPIEKQLLRMGPGNSAIIQHKAREVASAIGMPLQPQPQASAR